MNKKTILTIITVLVIVAAAVLGYKGMSYVATMSFFVTVVSLCSFQIWGYYKDHRENDAPNILRAFIYLVFALLSLAFFTHLFLTIFDFPFTKEAGLCLTLLQGLLLLLVVIDILKSFKRLVVYDGLKYIILLMPIWIILLSIQVRNLSRPDTTLNMNVDDKIHYRVYKNKEQNRSFFKRIDSLNIQASEILHETDKMLNYIEELRKNLINSTGGRNEDGKYLGMNEKTTVQNLLLGPPFAKTGEAYMLKEKILHYAKQQGRISHKEFLSPALDAKEDPLFKHDQEHKHQDFAHLHFEGRTMVQALEELALLELDIVDIERQALEEVLFKKSAGGITPIDSLCIY